MHPVAVEFELVQPLRSVRRLVNKFGELRFDPGRQRRRLSALLSTAATRPSRRERLSLPPFPPLADANRGDLVFTP
jgi:hypothetical protein